MTVFVGEGEDAEWLVSRTMTIFVGGGKRTQSGG